MDRAYYRKVLWAVHGWWCIALLTALSGCATSLTQVHEPAGEVLRVGTGNAGVDYEGSLWQDGGVLGELFVDHKARKVGDIVTVSIVEASAASNQAATKSGRKSSVSGGMESFFNLEKRYPSSHPFFNPFSSVKGGLESSFDGSGTTSRTGKLTAYLTARVTEVLGNGNLRIEGSREVMVNSERQYLLLSGIVRPKDISTSNVILSTYIADARIAYSGVGTVDDRQHPGWMARILDSVWPF